MNMEDSSVEISCIIISFSSPSGNFICVLFWSDIVPSIFIAATPVEVASKAIGFPGFIRAYYIVF